MSDKMLYIKGANLIKSRIVGWRSTYNSKFNDGYYLTLILDSGNELEIKISWFDYNNQAESNERADEEFENVVNYLCEEFGITREVSDEQIREH